MHLVSVRWWHCAGWEENLLEFFLPLPRRVISGLCKLGTIIICNGWKGNRQSNEYHARGFDIPSLVRPFMVRGLYPQKIVLARHHFSKKDAIEHAHISQQSAACDCFSQYSICPSVCSLLRYLPCSEVLSLSWSFLFILQTKGQFLFLFWSGRSGVRSRCSGAFTAGVSLVGQCSAVFSSPQYPYF